MPRSLKEFFSRQNLLSATAILVYLALAKLLLHLLSATQYGYFRDELYYIAASRHLDLGYVDFPPFIALITALTRWTLGDSLLALHFFPALAGAAIVVLAGLMARELGGGRFAQGLAALAVLVAPTFLGAQSILTMDPFDQLFWVLAIYVVLLMLKREDPRLWLLFGLVAGIGLLTKVTMLFLGAALVVGLLLTPNRRFLLSKWPWLGGALALALFSPYIVWQMLHGWPTLEFWRFYAVGKTYPVTPPEFLGQQILTMHPLTLPLWLAGLGYFFFGGGKKYRTLGWVYVILYVVFTIQQAKNYFLAATYPMLFAGGAVLIEQAAQRRQALWLRPAYIALLAVGGLATAPLAAPLLPVETLITYSQAFGGAAEVKQERLATAALPQHFADRFGWEELVASVAKVYAGLPPEEQAKACILTENYGEAGAIDFFGGAYHLPKAISGHNSYFIWGPDGCTGEVIISVGMSGTDLAPSFEKVTPAGASYCKYCMPYENGLPIFVGRSLKMDIREAWPGAKHYE
jgi:4-amino-4-deoxy-L-arabinose transferase-like glycosyltransferase